MRVNSSFTGIFTNRLVVWVGLALVMFAMFFTTSSFTKHPDRDLWAKKVNLIIREIGDRLLLQAGDSTSRILPVTEIKEGTFVLRFENEFVFNHDSLMVLSHVLFPKTEFPSGYTLTVHDCIKDDIVYGFQVNNTSPDILACKGRSQPRGCYTIEFVFPDLYKKVKEKKAKQTVSTEIDPKEINPKLAELTTTTFDSHINHRTAPGKVDHQKLNPKREESKTTAFANPLTYVVYGGVLGLLVVTLLIWRFGKVLKPVPAQNQNHTIVKESIQELPLGKFLFNPKGQSLLLGSEVISLTDKECKVLELLYKSFGELIPRETLMQEVWINEGVITSRSLDMFVSKLRKKLSRDPELRITNVHGKGYKLESIAIIV